MGRQEIVEHIQTELRGGTTGTDTDDVAHSSQTLCQHCGVPIDVDGPTPSDYVVHRVPSHGETEMNSVFYCGPSCFQDAMADLFEA